MLFPFVAHSHQQERQTRRCEFLFFKLSRRSKELHKFQYILKTCQNGSSTHVFTHLSLRRYSAAKVVLCDLKKKHLASLPTPQPARIKQTDQGAHKVPVRCEIKPSIPYLFARAK